jgi:hypothetical protein
MSTRSQIKFKDSEHNIYVYKHSDGYPEGVLPVLVPFVQEFFAERGNDECYFLAQVIRRFAIADYKEVLKEIADPESFYNRFTKPRGGQPYQLQFLGWGLDCIKHADIEYLYEIGSKGEIYVNGKKLTKAQITKYTLRAVS